MGKKINIKDLGARENTLCTKEIQKAVDLIDEAGGGTVIIPSGVYLSGTIHLKNTSLYLERGDVYKRQPSWRTRLTQSSSLIIR